MSELHPDLSKVPEGYEDPNVEAFRSRTGEPYVGVRLTDDEMAVFEQGVAALTPRGWAALCIKMASVHRMAKMMGSEEISILGYTGPNPDKGEDDGKAQNSDER